MAYSGIQRRDVLRVTGGLSVAGLAGCVGSEETGDFPSAEIEIIVPYGPEGGYDTYARLTASYLTEELDTPVNVRNVAGGEGQIGAREVYDAEPDGYTLGLMNVEQFSRDQIVADAPFDLTEMTWLATVAENITAIGTNLEYDLNWEEYVQEVQNGNFNFGTESRLATGSLGPALAGEIGGEYDPDQVLNNLVIHDGRGDMIPSLERGDIDIIAGSYSSIRPYHESDDLEIFITLIAEEEPPKEVPDAETLASANVDNSTEIAEINSPIRAFAGPPDIPQEETEILVDALYAVINDEEFREEADEMDIPIAYQDGKEAGNVVETTVTEWADREELLDVLGEE